MVADVAVATATVADVSAVGAIVRVEELNGPRVFALVEIAVDVVDVVDVVDADNAYALGYAVVYFVVAAVATAPQTTDMAVSVDTGKEGADR